MDREGRGGLKGGGRTVEVEGGEDGVVPLDEGACLENGVPGRAYGVDALCETCQCFLATKHAQDLRSITRSSWPMEKRERMHRGARIFSVAKIVHLRGDVEDDEDEQMNFDVRPRAEDQAREYSDKTSERLQRDALEVTMDEFPIRTENNLYAAFTTSARSTLTDPRRRHPPSHARRIVPYSEVTL